MTNKSLEYCDSWWKGSTIKRRDMEDMEMCVADNGFSFYYIENLLWLCCLQFLAILWWLNLWNSLLLKFNIKSRQYHLRDGEDFQRSLNKSYNKTLICLLHKKEGNWKKINISNTYLCINKHNRSLIYSSFLLLLSCVDNCDSGVHNIGQ